MESNNRQEAERVLEEQKLSPSQQNQRRQEVTPGLGASDFGKPGEGGGDEYYAPEDSGENQPTREAVDELQEGNRGGGPDEGMTGFGPGGASDAENNESMEEIERRGNA